MSPGGGKAKLKGKTFNPKRDPRHPDKKGLWNRTWRNKTGEPGGGPHAKEDHCRENWKFLANRFEGPGIQHPLGGSGSLTGTLVCNHIQLAWDVDRNKGNVLLMTKQNQKPQGAASKGGE